MSLITVKDLSVGYDGKTVADHISFRVDEGNYLCIVGENGSGKTTLMKTLLHLVRPVAGTIGYGEGMEGHAIGYLPQQSALQADFPATVREIVLSGCLAGMKRRPFYGPAEKKLAAENMEKMGVSALAKRCFRELSGGQQRRVLLARALCAAGKILLLDEPVAGLDPQAAEDMYALIRTLNEEGIAIVMISHDLKEALPYASHVLHMGKDVWFGAMEEYQARETGGEEHV